MEGKKFKGRPRKRWLDNVTDDCYHRGWSIVEATHLATDRQRWRTYITYGCHSVPWHRHDNNKNFDIWQKYSKGSRIEFACFSISNRTPIITRILTLYQANAATFDCSNGGATSSNVTAQFQRHIIATFL